MPLILKVYSGPVYKPKVNTIKTVPHLKVGLNIIHHKFRDDIINNRGFCDALIAGNVEIVEDSSRPATIKEVLGAIMDINKKLISITDNVWDLMHNQQGTLKDLYGDFSFQIETAFGVSWGHEASWKYGELKGITVKNLNRAIVELASEDMDMEGDE